ncbi:MAG: hypothetical protein WCL14_00145 [Bacteroidota bacterium]
MKPLIISFLIISIVTSCTYSKKEMVAAPKAFICTDTVHYAISIKPIVQSQCAIYGCHVNKGGANAVDYSTVAGVQSQASQIPIRLNLPFNDIHHMPNNATLTQQQIQDFTCWVNQGAKDN